MRSEWSRTAARWMFHSHLWLGVIATAIIAVVSLTGILLNHKRVLGLMPDVAHEADGSFEDALPLAELVRRAGAAVEGSVAAAGVDRMDVRPDAGLVKVRFGDAEVTEVTLDVSTGRVLEVGLRNDVFLEKLHSGEVFGDAWILLSDFAALALVVLLVSGLWIWLYPRSRL